MFMLLAKRLSRARKVFFRLAYLFIGAIVIASLLLSSCSKAKEAPAALTLPTKLATVALKGQVELPAGVSSAGQKVVNSLGQASADSQGRFSLKAVANARQFTLVESAAGTPMLMGWPDAQHQKINARSTAEVLFYMAAGLFLLPGEAQASVRDVLEKSPELDKLEQAIQQALAQDPEAFSKPNEAIDQALSQIIFELFPSGTALDAPPAHTYFGLTVNPGISKSGLTVNTTQGLNSIFLTNRYRRPGYCFIDRVSVVDSKGVETSSPDHFKEFEVKEITGVEAVVSTLNDLVQGKMGYEEVSTDPVDLTVPEGSAKAIYRLCVVGPGAGTGDYGKLSDAEKLKFYEVAGKFIILDFLVRFAMSFLIPTDKIDEFVQFFGATTLFTDLWSYAVATVPQALDEIVKGNAREAFRILISDFISKQSFRDHVVQQLIEGVQNAYGLAAADQALSSAKQYFNVLAIIDKILLVFDSSVILENLVVSNMADIWEVAATPPKVVLSPSTALLAYDDELTLTATVPEQSGSGVTLTYHWKNTSTSGDLTDGSPGKFNDFDSTYDKVTYKATNKEHGADTVTVQVYAHSATSAGDKQLIGEAQARITIESQGTINLEITRIPDYPATYTISANLMQKNGFDYSVTRWAQDPKGYKLPSTIIFSNMGESTYLAGEYKVVVFAYDKEDKVFRRTALSFKLKGGQNNIKIPFPYEESNEIWGYSTAGPEWPSDIYLYTSFEPATVFATWVVGKPMGLLPFSLPGVQPNPAKPGDTVKVDLTWMNDGADWFVPGDEKLILGEIWLYSWLDGEKYCVSYGGDFIRYIPVGVTNIYNTSFVIPSLKELPPAPVPPARTKPASPTASPTPTTTTKPSSTSTTSAITPQPSYSPTNTSATPSATSPSPSSTTPAWTTPAPSNNPSTAIDIWATTVNDPNGPRVQNLVAGSADRLYFWAQGQPNQDADFTLVITIQNGNQTPIPRHASQGAVINCGSMTGDFLKTPGTVYMAAHFGYTIFGQASITISARPTPTGSPEPILPLEVVVTNLAKNSGVRPPGATENNDWWYWDLTLKNPNSVGITLSGGQKHISTPYEDNTSALTTKMVDAFGTNYLEPGGEIAWHNGYMYFSKRPTPFQATRTVTFFGQDDLGRAISVEYSLTVTVD
jgi:hypothetical protein